jgi:hypothetical protein
MWFSEVLGISSTSELLRFYSVVLCGSPDLLCVTERVFGNSFLYQKSEIEHPTSEMNRAKGLSGHFYIEYLCKNGF